MLYNNPLGLQGFYIECFFFLYIIYLLVRRVHTCHGICVELRRQSAGVSPLLLPCEIWRWNSGYRAWQQMTFFAEPSHWRHTVLIYRLSTVTAWRRSSLVQVFAQHGQKPWVPSLASQKARCAHAHLSSQHSGGGGRTIRSSRPS